MLRTSAEFGITSVSEAWASGEFGEAFASGVAAKASMREAAHVNECEITEWPSCLSIVAATNDRLRRAQREQV
jgi:hypothetical protein